MSMELLDSIQVDIRIDQQILDSRPRERAKEKDPAKVATHRMYDRELKTSTHKTVA